MEKKLILFILVVLILTHFVVAIPQFLIFQGDVKIDGRIAPQGTLINFSISGTQIASSLVNSSGQYGPIVIQGFNQYSGRRFNITINGYDAQQIIYYNSPQNINLDLSTLTEKALKISNFFPLANNLDYNLGNQTFNISTQTGYSDPVKNTWFVDGNKVLEFTNTNFSSYIYERQIGDTSQHIISVTASDGYLNVSKEWTLLKEEQIPLQELFFKGYRKIGNICEPNWQCSGWSECSNGAMTRKCSDTNFCSYQFNKPAEVSGCEEQLGVTKGGNGILIGPLGIGLLISISLIIVLIGLLRKP